MEMYDVIIKYIVNSEVIIKTIADVKGKWLLGDRDDYERFYTDKACFRIKKACILSVDEFNFRKVEDK